MVRAALLIIDVQNDFCPGGSLPVPEGDQVVLVLNQWIAEFNGLIVASRDWHPPKHISFKERGGDWPSHGIQDTPGAAFHPNLHLPANTLLVSKGTQPDFDQYSAFDRTNLAETLRERGINRAWVGGLAQDICVRATGLAVLREGFETHVIRSATRAINVRPGDGELALAEMARAGAIIE
jgi:nicotinamidase/pyrazinamidase